MGRTEDDPAGSSDATAEEDRLDLPRPPRAPRDPAKYELCVAALALSLGVLGQLLKSSSMLYVGGTFGAIALGMLWYRVLNANRS